MGRRGGQGGTHLERRQYVVDASMVSPVEGECECGPGTGDAGGPGIECDRCHVSRRDRSFFRRGRPDLAIYGAQADKRITVAMECSSFSTKQ